MQQWFNMYVSLGSKGTDDGVVLRNKTTSNDDQRLQYRQSADSPIPPRAKFLKKFGIKKPSRGGPSAKTTEKKITRKQSIEQKQGPLSRKLSASLAGQKPPQKQDKASAAKLTKQKSGTAMQQQQRPMQKKPSKSKMGSPQDQQAQRKLSKTKPGSKDAQVSKQNVAISKKSPKQKKAPKTQEVKKENGKKEQKTTANKEPVVEDTRAQEKPEGVSDNPYIFFASAFVDSLIKESVPREGKFVHLSIFSTCFNTFVHCRFCTASYWRRIKKDTDL